MAALIRIADFLVHVVAAAGFAACVLYAFFWSAFYG